MASEPREQAAGVPDPLANARAHAQAGQWEGAFDDLQRALQEVRARGDAGAERALLSEMSGWLARSGHPARAAMVRRYLDRGFRPPLGYDGPAAHEPP